MINISNLSSLVENSQGSELLVPSYAEMELVGMNEATYYGKNKDLLAVEKILDEMCVIARTRGTGAREFSLKMTEVGNRLAALFGFKSLLINSSILDLMHWQEYLNNPGYTYIHSNIYKYTLVALDNGKTATVVTADDSHNSVKFDPKFKYVMRMGIGPGLFVDRGSNSLTGGEILAIILHEIGHNFYIGPVKELLGDALGLLSMRDITQLLLYLVSMLELDAYSILDDALPAEIQLILRQVKNTMGPIWGIIESVSKIVEYPAILLILPALILLYIVKIPFEFPSAWLGYDAEKYSDAFATSYGYGTELVSGLVKITDPGIPKAKPVINDIASIPYGILNVVLSIFTQFLDPHPNTMARLNNNIKYMEEAGKHKMSPALKKEYDETLKLMYEYRDVARNYKGVGINKLDNRYHLWLQSLTHVTDVKDIGSTFNIFKKYRNLDFD